MTWSPSSDPAVVLLSQRPNFLPSTPNALADRFAVERDGPEGAYSGLPEHDLQILFLPDTSPSDGLAAVIPIDDDILDRIDAVLFMAPYLYGYILVKAWLF